MSGQVEFLSPDIINLQRMVYCVHLGVTGYKFQIKIVFLSLKIVCDTAKSVDPDEMLHYAAFHLGLHCLPNYTFRNYQGTKG